MTKLKDPSYNEILEILSKLNDFLSLDLSGDFLYSLSFEQNPLKIIYENTLNRVVDAFYYGEKSYSFCGEYVDSLLLKSAQSVTENPYLALRDVIFASNLSLEPSSLYEEVITQWNKDHPDDVYFFARKTGVPSLIQASLVRHKDYKNLLYINIYKGGKLIVIASDNNPMDESILSIYNQLKDITLELKED